MGLVVLIVAVLGLVGLGFLKREVAPTRPEQKRMEAESAGNPMGELLRSPLKTYPPLTTVEAEELKNTVAVVETDFGRFAFEFYPEVAPQTVQNFIWLVKEHFYDVQLIASGITGEGIRLDGISADPKHQYRVKAEFSTIPVEAGAVLLERAIDPAYYEGEPEKAEFLNSGSTTVWVALAPKPAWVPNYTVFGKVIGGEDVVRELSSAFTKGLPGFATEVLVYRVRLVPRSQLAEVLAQPVEEPRHIPWAPQRTVLPPG
jgi:cyclophilin family peptidyl-prolyl cis-trans isomerase